MHDFVISVDKNHKQIYKYSNTGTINIQTLVAAPSWTPSRLLFNIFNSHI